MKKSISILLAVLLCVVFCLPTTTAAETYNLSDTDMSISVDATNWYVFTRDNIANNSELEFLEITYDYMYDVFYDNDAYMDALLLYTDGEYVELFVRKKALDTGIVNLSNYKDSEVSEFAKELAKQTSAETHAVHKSQYKFAKIEYTDSDYYLCEFYTIVNKDTYTITFQATAPFSTEEYAEIEKIVNSIAFDVDPSIKEETGNFDSIGEKALIGAVAAGCVGGIGALINKKKKKSEKTDNNIVTNGPDLD